MPSDVPCFEDPRSALKRHGLRPKRSFGQNFLVSQRAVAVIAECAVPGGAEETRVVEIGAGVGTLTAGLLHRGASVIAVERDRDMCQVLRTDFGPRPRFELLEADAAKVDYRALLADDKGVIAGNLPYQLTGRLIRAIVDAADRLLRAVVMVQEEVADRLVAPAGDHSRGALSVIVQSRFCAKTVLRLKPAAFCPAPKVRSAVVCLTPEAPSPLDEARPPELFDRLVNAAFTARRKTIRNSLMAARVAESAIVEAALRCAGVDPGVRAERLEQADFFRLCDAFTEAGWGTEA